MIKIGILTFHNVLNYGAVLQTYALQQNILKNDNVEVNVLDYNSPEVTYGYSYHNLLKNPLMAIPKAYILRRKKVVFNDFAKNYLKLSDVRYDSNNIKQANDYYDAFIVGSDQVWNYNITKCDTTYLLDFADEGKRFSYAASLGLNKIEGKYVPIYRECLKKFSGISVREVEGQNVILNQLKLENCYVNVDPTLLLSKKEWDELAAPRIIKGKYILVYSIKYSEDLIQTAKKIAKEKGCKVAFISSKIIKGVESISNPTVSEFLSLFKYADFTAVNSFHGTVFSIIFNKKMLVELVYKDGRNARIENLLEKCVLTNQIYKENNYSCIYNDINWGVVDLAVSQEQVLARNYLRKIIKEYLENET